MHGSKLIVSQSRTVLQVRIQSLSWVVQERAQADSCKNPESAEGGAHDWEAGGSPVDAFAWGSIVLGGGPLDVGSEFERRLSIGANIACRLRGAIREQLGGSLLFPKNIMSHHFRRLCALICDTLASNTRPTESGMARSVR